MAEAIDALGERAVGPALALIDIGKLVGAAGVEIALEDIGREIVVARNRVDGRAAPQARLSDIHRGVSSRRAGGLTLAPHCPRPSIMPTTKIRQGNVSAAKLRYGNAVSNCRYDSRALEQSICRRSPYHDFKPRPHPHHPCRQPAAQRSAERTSGAARSGRKLR
jgi:hypothetical protein